MKELWQWPFLSLRVLLILAVYLLLSCQFAEGFQAVPKLPHVDRNHQTPTPLNNPLQIPKVSNTPKGIQPVSLLLGFTLNVQLGFKLRPSHPRHGAFNHHELQRNPRNWVIRTVISGWQASPELGSQLLRRTLSTSHNLVKNKKKYFICI